MHVSSLKDQPSCLYILVGWLVCHNFPKRQGSYTSMLLYPYSLGICPHNKHWRQREGKSSGGVRGLGRGPRPQRRSAALPCQGSGHAAQEMNDVMNGKCQRLEPRP